MAQQARVRWNRRRFLGAAVSVLSIAPLGLRAESKENLPSCSREGRHGPWRIEANAGSYSISREVEARGLRGVELLRFRSQDGSVSAPSSRVEVGEDDDGVDFSATVPAFLEAGSSEYRLQPAESPGRPVYLRQTGADRAAPIEAVLFVDDREIAKGELSSWDDGQSKTIGPDQMIRLNVDWSADPLPSMRAGREAVMVLRTGHSDPNGADFLRVPIDLGGVTVATRTGANFRREARRALQAKQCSAGAGCYLTTACCEHLGRADDCWELETLRWYRDRVLALQPDGPAVLATYYEQAPAIVAALPSAGVRRTWALARIYWGTVIPCALLVRLGGYRAARRRYERTFRRLHARWLPA